VVLALVRGEAIRAAKRMNGNKGKRKALRAQEQGNR
jgi:hypothetical protein